MPSAEALMPCLDVGEVETLLISKRMAGAL
jgi:hypothetical protein